MAGCATCVFHSYFHKGDREGFIALAACGLEDLFSSCAVESVFWFLVGNRFWCYLLTYLEYNRVVALC